VKKHLKNYERTLIIAAHPDDEILGCGATMKRLCEDGAVVRTVILGEGKTAIERSTHSATKFDLQISLSE